MFSQTRPWVVSLTLCAALLLDACKAKPKDSKAGSERDALASASATAQAPAAPAAAPITQQIFLIMDYRIDEPEYLHSVWFMDTTGNEYRYSSKEAANDVVRKAIDDSQLDAAEIERVVAASKLQPRRVPAAELERMLAVLAKVEVVPLDNVAQTPCNVPGVAYLYAYVLEKRLQVLTPRFLRGEECGHVTTRNPSAGASELADWLEKLGKPTLLPI